MLTTLASARVYEITHRIPQLEQCWLATAFSLTTPKHAVTVRIDLVSEKSDHSRASSGRIPRKCKSRNRLRQFFSTLCLSFSNNNAYKILNSHIVELARRSQQRSSKLRSLSE